MVGSTVGSNLSNELMCHWLSIGTYNCMY